MRIDVSCESAESARQSLSSDATTARTAISAASEGAEALSEVAPAGMRHVDDLVDLTDRASAFGPALSLVGHLAAEDEGVATTGWGYVRDASLRTVADVAVDAGMAEAIDAAGRNAGPAGLASAGLAVADLVTEDASAAGVLVDMGIAVDPSAQITAGAYAYIDSAAAMTNLARGDAATAYQQADAIQAGALDGDYGVATQGLTIAAGVATGDADVVSATTDRAAEQGERGLMPALGNYIGDTWADVAGHNVPTEGRFVDADEYDRSLRFGALFGF